MLKKGNRVQYFIFGMFALFGLIFFIIGIFIAVSQNIDEEDRVYTTAIIEDIVTDRDADGDTTYNVFISYYVDRQLYERKLNSYISSYYEGKEIEIYYDKNNPNNVRTDSSNVITYVFSGLGLVFFIIGLVGILNAILKTRKIKKLKISGRKIYANYVSTEINTTYSVNGRNPFYIICEWNDPMTNIKYIFKSENIWFDPENYIQQYNIQMFKVYINPNNIKEYVVDTSNIENNVVDLT